MCGIIGAIVTDNPVQVKERLYHIYVSQAHRGSDGAGITILRKGEILRRRLENPLDLFNNKMILKRKDIVLLHHRFPTSTPNEARYNHPFNDEENTLSLIHNGHISNYEKLYRMLKKQGHTFESENLKVGYSETGYYNQKGSYSRTSSITDSEVIVHLIEGRTPQKAIRVMNGTLSGAYALSWVYKGDNQVYLYRKDNPLIAYEDYEGNRYFSSEYPNNPFLDGYITKGVKLDEGVLYSLDKQGLKHLSSVKMKKKRNKPKSYSNERWVMEGGEFEMLSEEEIEDLEEWNKSFEKYERNSSLLNYAC